MFWCCCPDCKIVPDDAFDREELGDDYTVVDGTAAIEGGSGSEVLRLSDAPAFVVVDALHPDGPTGGSKVSAKIVLDTASTAGLLALYGDADNNVGAEVAEGSGCYTFRLFQRVAASKTYLTAPRPLPPMPTLGYHLHVCAVAGDEGTPVEDFELGLEGTVAVGDDWTNKDDGLTCNEQFAQYAWLAGGDSTTFGVFGFHTQLLSLIPEGSTITGLKADIKARDGSEASSQVKWTYVRFNITSGLIGDARNPDILLDFNPAWTETGEGGSGDMWSSGITRDDFNADFGIVVGFTNLDEFERGMDLDCVTLDIWWTENNGTPGHLSAHVGTGSEWPDKVYLEAELPADLAGEQVAMELSAGEATFDDRSWKYHKGESLHTTCPECLPPCVFFTDAAPEAGCHWDAGLVSKHTNPQPDEGTKISVTATPDSPTDPITVFVDYDGTDLVSITVESDGADGTLTIDRDGVELESVALPGYAGTAVEISVCWFAGVVIATAADVSLTAHYAPIGGEYFGIDDTNVTYTDFVAQSLAVECDDCVQAPADDCEPPCVGGLRPAAMRMRVRLITSEASLGVEGCDFGPMFNGTYILALGAGCLTLDCPPGEDNCYGAGECYWGYGIPFFVDTSEEPCFLTAFTFCDGSLFRHFALFAGIEVDAPNNRHRLVGIIAEFPPALPNTSQRGRYVGAWRAGSTDLDCLNNLPYGPLTYDADDGVYFDYPNCELELLPV